MLFIFVVGEVDFESLREFAPRKHDASSTAFTFQSDICAETRDCPLVGTARVLLAKAQVIVETQVGEHGFGDWRIRDWECCNW